MEKTSGFVVIICLSLNSAKQLFSFDWKVYMWNRLVVYYMILFLWQNSCSASVATIKMIVCGIDMWFIAWLHANGGKVLAQLLECLYMEQTCGLLHGYMLMA